MKRSSSGQLEALWLVPDTYPGRQKVIAQCECGERERIPLDRWDGEDPPTECRACRRRQKNGKQLQLQV